MSGVLWATASGIGFGVFQSLNRKAIRGIEDPYVSTFLQLSVATGVLVIASLVSEDLGQLRDASGNAIAIFAAAGIIHFVLGWLLLNISQARIGASRTAPLITLTPLFGLVLAVITLGLLAATAALGGALIARGSLGAVRSIARNSLALKLSAAVLVAFATWFRLLALDEADVAVVLATNLVAVPITLVLAPLLVGRHLERADARVWAGGLLVVTGVLALIAIEA